MFKHVVLQYVMEHAVNNNKKTYIHTLLLTYIHTHMHACMHAYIHTYPYIHTLLLISIHTHTHTHVCYNYLLSYTGIYMYIHLNVRSYTYLCTYSMVKSVRSIFIAIITVRIRLTMKCLAFDGDVSLTPSLPMTNNSALCY
jgi:hypothetical protein